MYRWLFDILGVLFLISLVWVGVILGDSTIGGVCGFAAVAMFVIAYYVTPQKDEVSFDPFPQPHRKKFRRKA